MSWTPLQLSNLLLWAPTHNLASMWQAADDAVALTPPCVTTDPVGQIDDPSPCAHRIYAVGASRRPTWSVDGLPCSLVFDDGMTYMVVKNSLTAFSPLYSGTPTGAILLWLSVDADGTSEIVFDSCQSTTANVGLILTKTSANKLSLQMMSGTAGVVVVSATTATSFTASLGLTPIAILFGPTSVSIQIGTNAAETFNYTGTPAAAGAAAKNDFAFGSRSDGPASGGLFGKLANMVITAAIPSASDLTSYRAYTPLTDGQPIVSVSVTGPAQPRDASGLKVWYDMGDGANLFQNAAKTQPLTASGQTCWVIGNKSLDGLSISSVNLNRDAVIDADGHQAVWGTYQLNSLNVLTWDGTKNYALPAIPSAGAFTYIVVARNRTTATGSHLMSGSSYWAITGSQYAGNYTPGESHSICHQVGGIAIDCDLVNKVEDWNIFEFVRRGVNEEFYVNGVQAIADPAHAGGAGPSLSTQAFPMTNMGKSFNDTTYINWHLVGEVAEVLIYNVALPRATCDQIRWGLTNKWAIPNVTLSTTGLITANHGVRQGGL